MAPKLFPGGPRVFPERSFCSKRSFRKEAGEENGPGCGKKPPKALSGKIFWRKEIFPERSWGDFGSILAPREAAVGSRGGSGRAFWRHFCSRALRHEKSVKFHIIDNIGAMFFGCCLF